MEKLTHAEKKTILDVVKRLKTDISTPVSIEGGCLQRDILREIESLRRKMVEEESKKTAQLLDVEKNVVNVTHDLKTPLAVIEGYAECMEDGIGKENYPTLIREQAEKMNDTVVQIIESIRSDESRHTEEIQLIKLPSLMKYEGFSRSSKQNHPYKIKIDRMPNLSVFVKKNAFKSVLENLISNAVKHSDKRMLTVKISAKPTLTHVVLSVKDNGSGIGKEDLPHIFERFYKGDKARTDHSTGVGLSYVKETVESFGGFVSVKSKVGKYTVFSIHLPAYRKGRSTEINISLVRSLLNVFLFPFVYVYDFFNIFYQLLKEAGKQIKKHNKGGWA